MPLPDGYVAYSQSPVFTEKTVPAALLKGHATKPGVWALIHVLEGKLLYRVLDRPAETILVPDQPPGVIESEVLHEVAPLGPVRFFVEFYREPKPSLAGAEPSSKREP